MMIGRKFSSQRRQQIAVHILVVYIKGELREITDTKTGWFRIDIWLVRGFGHP